MDEKLTEEEVIKVREKLKERINKILKEREVKDFILDEQRKKEENYDDDTEDYD